MMYGETTHSQVLKKPTTQEILYSISLGENIIQYLPRWGFMVGPLTVFVVPAS